MGSLARRLEKERLKQDLVARQQDYEAVADKLRWETNRVEHNSLQAQQKRLFDEIEQLEQQLEALEDSLKGDNCSLIIAILEPHFEREKLEIQKAYRLSLPERLLEREFPSSVQALISSLQLPKSPEERSFLDKFIGNLLLSQNVNNELKLKLQKWAEEHIQECPQLLEQLQLERQHRQQQSCPGLLVAISYRKGSYVLEAWSSENITQYQQYSSFDCEELVLDQQTTIPTDKDLSNVPESLKKLIAQSLERYQRNLKQIHIFLPTKFMNHAVDGWDNWQENLEENDNDDIPTIGEDYEVLIRCSERLRGKSPSTFAWREKAEIFKSKLSQPAQQIFMLGDSSNPKTLRKKLKQQKQAIAVKIPTVFPKKEEPGMLLWQAAVPLALWIRQQLPDIENLSVLDELLQDCHLKDVPNQVKIKRLDATDCDLPENHIGRHLCLLWDDPNILPPEQLLTQNKL